MNCLSSDPSTNCRAYLCILSLALVLGILSPVEARADLSRSRARKLIQTMAGWSLPGSAVRVRSVSSISNESAEAAVEIQTVFRLALNGGRWRLSEIRTGQDRWERLEIIAGAAKVELPSGDCDAPQFPSSRSGSELTNRRARCLIASLFGVQLPSDDVRIKDISSFGLSLGPESAALVTAMVQADFRFARVASGWRVAEFKSGNRDWVNVTDLPAAIDRVKQSAATEELSRIAKALGDFRRERGHYVIAEHESVLIDHLSPKYLARVIRVDPWHRPYRYDGQHDHFSLRSLGPDGKPNTPDDIVLTGP